MHETQTQYGAICLNHRHGLDLHGVLLLAHVASHLLVRVVARLDHVDAHLAIPGAGGKQRAVELRVRLQLGREFYAVYRVFELMW